MERICYLLSLLVILSIPWEGVFVVGGLATMSKLLGLMLAAAWLLKVVSTGARRPDAIHLAVLAFAGWAATSLLWTLDAERSPTRVLTYVMMAVLTLILWDIYRSSERIAAALQAFVLGLWVPVVSTASNYIAQRESVYGRFSASGDNANTTAIILALGVPVAWHLAAFHGAGGLGRLRQGLNFAYVPAAIGVITLTATRFAMIMVVPAILFALWTVGRLTWIQRALIVALLGGGLLALPDLVPQASFARLGTVDEELASGDFNGRATIWRLGLEVWAEHPVVGVGCGAFRKTMMPYWGRPKAAHNSFVSILTELGVVGLTLWLAILAAAVYYAWRQPGWASRFWLTMLVVWGLGNLAMTWAHTKSTWLFLGLLVAEARLPRSSDEQPDRSPAAALGGSPTTGEAPL